MPEQIDIKRQLELALQGLDALSPFAKEAGIITDYVSAYDEWEGIVQAVFVSFVVMPLCDTSGLWAPDEFNRLGFAPSVDTKVAVIACHEGNDFAIFDILEAKNGRMTLVLRPVADLSGSTELWVLPDDRHAYRVERL